MQLRAQKLCAGSQKAYIRPLGSVFNQYLAEAARGLHDDGGAGICSWHEAYEVSAGWLNLCLINVLDKGILIVPMTQNEIDLHLLYLMERFKPLNAPNAHAGPLSCNIGST